MYPSNAPNSPAANRREIGASGWCDNRAPNFCINGSSSVRIDMRFESIHW